MSKQAIGTMGWLDLTVDNAPQIKTFYTSVVGWNSVDVDMGEYADFMMQSPETGKEAAGICHKRGSNSDIPSQWLPYFIVADIQASLAAVEQLGGSAISKVRSYGNDQFVIIKDPAGAICALYQEA